MSFGLAENFLMMSIFVSDLRAISIGIVADSLRFANRHLRGRQHGRSWAWSSPWERFDSASWREE